MVKKQIVEQLQNFKKEIKKDIPITKMILFGSQAWGKPHKDSDVDLIVVSPIFRRKRPLNRGINLHLRWNLDYPVDFLCYTPEEFNKLKKQITIVQQALKEGVEIE